MFACATVILAPVALASPIAPSPIGSSFGGSIGIRNAVLGRILTFSGFQWRVKDSGAGKYGPGENYWSSSATNVSVDPAGRLHLWINHEGNTWFSTEVDSQRTMGYGTYRWVIEGDVTRLDRNVSIGTYDLDPAQDHREIDIEHSRWAKPGYPFSSQFVVQPFGTPDRQNVFNVPPATQYVEEFTWTPQGVSFAIIPGSDPSALPTHTWIFHGKPPTTNAEKTMMNYWLVGGRPPLSHQPSELVIDSFAFYPLGLPVGAPS